MGEVPPVTVVLIAPSQTPGQVALVCELTTVKAEGCVTLVVLVAVQFNASVTKMEYVPAHKLIAVLVLPTTVLNELVHTKP